MKPGSAGLRALRRCAAAWAVAAAPACLPGFLSAEPRPSEAEIGEEQVYLTPDQAVREIYDGVAAVDTVVARLEPAERSAIARKLGGPLPEGPVVVLVPRGAGGAPLGYAVIGEEIGKYRPITFMVGAGPELKVQGVEVLVYRESRGGEVRRERFLRQYRGKRAADPIRINRDILNVAGATLSVNAMNFGVKRVLAVLEVLAARNALGPARTGP
jgi:hypothetical protein